MTHPGFYRIVKEKTHFKEYYIFSILAQDLARTTTVSQSSEKLVNADCDDLLDSNGAIDGWNAEINRVPAMWIMPGNSNDEQVGFMICGEYFRSRYLGFPKFYH